MSLPNRSPWDRARAQSKALPRRLENHRRRPAVENLENRQLLAASAPDIQMISATTHDSQNITFTYDVLNAPLQSPVDIGVSRSSDPALSADDLNIATLKLDPTQSLDQAGHSAAAVGVHEVTLALPGGLPPNPAHPYVLVVADPSHALAGSNPSLHTAEFRTHVIGVITHGGIQPKSWKNGPPWELKMARELRAEGYDTVIPYIWVSQSNHAGAAAKQAPVLTRKVAAAAGAFPASEPVDVQFIGHSEGAVINGLVIQRLQSTAPPQMQAGYLQETMLDPHAANNGVQGQQYSVGSGLLGWIARLEITDFQARAKDPVVLVPSNVDNAEVFFQHTPASQAETNHGMYNLWGQVPVAGPAHYFDLTGHGISHAGRFGVQDWYLKNVVPTLAEGAPRVDANVLTIQPGFELGQKASLATTTNRPTYTGTAAPGTTIRLYARAGFAELMKVGEAVASEQGTWSITTRHLATGQYRIVAVANVPNAPGQRPIHMRPTAWGRPVNVGPSTGGLFPR